MMTNIISSSETVGGESYDTPLAEVKAGGIYTLQMVGNASQS